MCVHMRWCACMCCMHVIYVDIYVCLCVCVCVCECTSKLTITPYTIEPLSKCILYTDELLGNDFNQDMKLCARVFVYVFVRLQYAYVSSDVYASVRVCKLLICLDF